MRSNVPAGKVFPYRFAGLVVLTLLWFAAPIHAAPKVIEEQAQVEMPGPAGQWITGIGMSGDSMLVATRREFNEAGVDVAEMHAYLFLRTAAGQWQPVSTLVQTRGDPGDAFSLHVAMEGSLGAVMEGGGIYVYERRPDGAWTRTATLQVQTSGGAVRIDGGTIVTGRTLCAWEAFRKNTAATWEKVGGIPFVDSSDECVYGSVDVSGSTVVVGRSRAGSIGQSFEPSLRLYTPISFSPTMTTILSPHGENDVYFGANTAIDGSMLLTNSAIAKGLTIFRRNSGGQWDYLMSATAADAYRDRSPYNISIPHVSSNLVISAETDNDYRGLAAGVLDVFRRNSDGRVTQIARLAPSDGDLGVNLGSRVAISGQRIAATANRPNPLYGPSLVYVFQLPSDLSQPALVQENFQVGNGGNWTPIAGSSFSVVSAGTSRVYRQSSATSGAGSFLTNMDWTDQSIRADVRPTAFVGADRWFGLAVRRTDPANYYYATMRSSNTIDLKRMRNGSFTTLASAPLPVRLNRNYRLQLEAVGTRIRAFVDGKLAVEAQDSALTHGQAGVQMYRTRADYDNIVISPNSLTLYDDAFQYNDYWWTRVDGSWAPHFESGEEGEDLLGRYRQSSTVSGARAVIGVSTGDQVVQATARALEFAGTDVWFGVMARYVDSRNYYYLTVRDNGTLSLRKLVNDNIVVLGTAPLTVTANTWYNLRLEAVGSSLRAYVNNELYLEATDTSFSRGRYGLVTYKTAADYDVMQVSQP